MHRFRPKSMAAENITASSKNNHLPRTLHSEKTIFLFYTAKSAKYTQNKCFWHLTHRLCAVILVLSKAVPILIKKGDPA